MPDPNVDLGTGVGCARFQVVFVAGGAPTIEATQNTGACPIGELKLLSDTAGSFDAVTGTLRVAVVMENVGTVATIPRLTLRFNAVGAQGTAKAVCDGGGSRQRTCRPS